MKKFIAGLVVGLMLSATAVFAGESISATFADFNFSVNGQPKTVSAKPIVYNGTSYLPVRELSTLLGYSVDYKADTRTISLMGASQPAPSKDQMNTSDINSDKSNLIRGRDLHSNYGVEIRIIDPKADNGPVALTYNGNALETSECMIIDGLMYFNRDILTKLGISQ